MTHKLTQQQCHIGHIIQPDDLNDKRILHATHKNVSICCVIITGPVGSTAKTTKCFCLLQSSKSIKAYVGIQSFTLVAVVSSLFFWILLCLHHHTCSSLPQPTPFSNSS